MRTIRERKTAIAILAISLLFAACKGDSPTAPPPGGGGGTPPVTGVSLVLTSSNGTPVVDSTVTITATVTQSGSAVPNGTAVEFAATGGLIDGAAAATIKTTTNGVATVTLSSSSAGKITVQATVSNVSKNVEVEFKAKAPVETQPDLTPVITSVTPAIGRPAGGETIRITGKNFRSPVRVLFNTGGIAPVEAFVSSVGDTLIEAVTPAVNLGAGQQLVADIVVITEAGTTKEQRLEVTDGFTFQNEQLTPIIYTVSPNSGPAAGGTVVKIFGEGFQAPVQVMFGLGGLWNEVQVLSVKYGEITFVTPPRSTVQADPTTFFTDLRVVNIHSNTTTSLPNSFQYLVPMTITAVSPTEGPSSGGTRVTIDGSGFVGPVTITVGGRVAQPLSVSGTKIIAITDAVEVSNCADVSGVVIVTQITTGTAASSATAFTYKTPKPLITAINPSSANPGQSVQVSVKNVLPGVVRIKLGDRELFPSGAVYNDDGSAVFTVSVPTNFVFTTEACSVGLVTGEMQVASTIDVTYTNLENGCTNTLTSGLEVEPSDTSCQLPPPPDVTVTTPISPGCADTGTVAVGSSGTASISFRNDGGQALTVVQTGESGDPDSEFSYTPGGGLLIEPGQTGTYTVTFTPTNSGAHSPTVTFTTNDPDEGSVSVCVAGNSP